MRTYCIANSECVSVAQSCISVCDELYSVLCGGLNGKKIQKGGNVCVHIADTIGCTVGTNRTS